jgi:hypothetical protein
MGSDENDAIGPDDGEEVETERGGYARGPEFWFTPPIGVEVVQVDEPAGTSDDGGMTDTRVEPKAMADTVKGTTERDNPFFWLTAQAMGLPSGLLAVVAGEEAREVKKALEVQPMDTVRANAEAVERAAGRVPKARKGTRTAGGVEAPKTTAQE